MLETEARQPGPGPGAGKALAVAAASLILPGLGQFLNRERPKALIWLLLPLLLIAVEAGSSEWGRYIALVRGAPVTLSVMEAGAAKTADQAGGAASGSLADLLAAQPAGSATEGEGAASSGGGEADLYGSDSASPISAESLYGDIEASPEAAATAATPASPATDENSLYGDFAEGGDLKATYVWPDYSRNEGGRGHLFRDYGGFFTRGLWGLLTLGRLVIDHEYSGARIVLFDKVSRWKSADNSVVLLGNGLIAAALLVLAGFFWVFGIIDAYRTRKRLESGAAAEDFGSFVARVWESLFVYIVSAPAFVLMLLFTLIPIVFTFLLAFTNYTYKIKLGLYLINWSGLDTFKLLAMDPGWLRVFGQIFLWTIFWALMSSFTVYALGFINALIVESPLIKAKRVWRTIMILPWAIPSLVTLMVFRNAFDKDGLINQFLFASGLMEPVTNFLFHIGLEGRPDQPIFWFQPTYNGNLAKAVVVLVNLWLGAPYHMMMIIGVLATISRELYEAAEIDGATPFQRFRFITLPMVLAATVPALIMTFSFNFNNFGAVYFLTGGGPIWDPAHIPDSMRIISAALPGQTDILISWIYKLSFVKDFEQYNVAAVYSIIIFALVGGFATFNMLRTKSFKDGGAE